MEPTVTTGSSGNNTPSNQAGPGVQEAKPSKEFQDPNVAKSTGDANITKNVQEAKIAEGVHVVNIANHAYQLDEKALERILLREDVKDLPVVVVSVAGTFRAGKSFLLNYFLRYLTAPEEARNENGDWLGTETEPLTGFSWRGGSERNTTGILMWSEPYIMTLPSGDKVAVLLMDTQGTFDSSSTVRDCSTIFALSTLVSSVLIYNIKENIKEDDMQHLQLFTEYARLLKNEDGKKAFQVLQFLVRDWPYEYEHEYGRKGGEELLAIRMQETEGMPKELRELRQQLRSSFETMTCFLMPYPGRNVRKKTFAGSLAELDEEFKNALKELVPSIFAPANLTPKLTNGQLVKARDIFIYFKSYMEIFNSDKIPTPASIAEATAKAALLSAVDDARELYEARMERVTSDKQPSLTALALDDEHRKALAAARAAFNDKKKMASKKQSDAYLAQMTHDLEDRLPQYVLMNDAKLRKAIDDAKTSYEAAIRKVHGDNMLCLHPLDLEDAHNEAVQEALSVFDAKRKSLPNMPDMERIKFQERLEENLKSLRNINEQYNKMAVAVARTEFSTNMEALLTRDPPLDDDDFEAKYKEVKANAVIAFQNKRNKPTTHEDDSYKSSLLQAMATQFINLKKINKSANRKLFQKAMDYYDTAMSQFWTPGWWCVHPADLSDKHQDLKQQALNMFHPGVSVSDDYDKELLSDTLDSKYYHLKEQNNATNELAVSSAVWTYISEMDDKTRASWWWLTIVPMIVSYAKRSRYHRESKEAAMNVFYNRRRRSWNSSWDYYKYRLNQRMDELYQNY